MGGGGGAVCGVGAVGVRGAVEGGGAGGCLVGSLLERGGKRGRWGDAFMSLTLWTGSCVFPQFDSPRISSFRRPIPSRTLRPSPSSTSRLSCLENNAS